MKKINFKNLGFLFLFILIPLLTGAISGFTTQTGEGSWYMNLEKPVFNPPSWIFAPVWTYLYITMGLCAYLIWLRARKTHQGKFALWLFAMQLIFNFFWSILFFGLQSPALAFYDIIVLLGILFIMEKRFRKIEPFTKWLLTPYIMWVSFATVLNLSILALNK